MHTKIGSEDSNLKAHSHKNAHFCGTRFAQTVLEMGYSNGLFNKNFWLIDFVRAYAPADPNDTLECLGRKRMLS
jgi:hypothetical protein